MKTFEEKFTAWLDGKALSKEEAVAFENSALGCKQFHLFYLRPALQNKNSSEWGI